MAIGGGDRAEDMQLAGERRALLIDDVTKLLVLNKVCWAKVRNSSPASVRVTVRLSRTNSGWPRSSSVALDLARKRRRADVHGPRAAAKMAAFRQMQKGFQIA